MFEKDGHRYTGKVVVKIKKASEKKAAAVLSALQKQLPNIALTEHFQTKAHFGVFHVTPENDVFAAKKALTTNSDVEWAEVEQLHKLASISPNDPYYSTGGATWPAQWGPQKCRMPQMWALGTGSPSVGIAVLDSGLHINPANGQLAHPDLQDSSRYIYGPIFSPPATDNYPVDWSGHGTRMTGIAAAESNNSVGIAGMNWQCPVYVVRIADEDMSWTPTAFLKGVHAACTWAQTQNIKLVINLSFAANSGDSIQWEACQEAFTAGAVLCASSGNMDSEDPNDYVHWPAAYAAQDQTTQCVLSVGASAIDDTIWTNSCGGAELLLTAPGVDITTTNTDDAEYAKVSGTSEACAHVSGYASVLWGMYPSFTNVEMREAMLANTHKFGQSVRDNAWGFGRITFKRVPLESFSTDATTYGPNQQNTFYRDAAGRIVHFKCDMSNGGQYTWDVWAGGGSSIATLPSAGSFSVVWGNVGDGLATTTYLFYRTAYGDVELIQRNDTNNSYTVTTWAGPSVGTEAAAGRPAGQYFYVSPSNLLQVFYRTYTSKIIRVTTGGADVWAGDGSSVGAPSAGSDPFIMLQNDTSGSQYQIHMFYVSNAPSSIGCIVQVWEDPDATLHTLTWAGPGSQTNTPVCGGRTIATMFFGTKQHIFYLDRSGCIQHVEYNPDSGYSSDIWAGPGSVSGSPAAKGEPVVIKWGNQQHMWYRDINDNLQHVWWNGVWQPTNYLQYDTWAGTGAKTAAPAMASDPTAMNWRDTQQIVSYVDASGNVQHIWYSSDTGQLCWQTLTYGQQPSPSTCVSCDQPVEFTPAAAGIG